MENNKYFCFFFFFTMFLSNYLQECQHMFELNRNTGLGKKDNFSET